MFTKGIQVLAVGATTWPEADVRVTVPDLRFRVQGLAVRVLRFRA